MNAEQLNGIVEELAEVSSMQELKALWCFGQSSNNEYVDARFVHDFKVAVARLRNSEEVAMPKIEELEARLAELTAQLTRPTTPPVKVVRGSKRYRLLSDDVSWSTKPQVHAVMAILRAHAEVGNVLEESTIVEAMVANERVLETRQGGKRIWDYYKGTHCEGLMAHGNVERV